MPRPSCLDSQDHTPAPLGTRTFCYLLGSSPHHLVILYWHVRSSIHASFRLQETHKQRRTGTLLARHSRSFNYIKFLNSITAEAYSYFFIRSTFLKTCSLKHHFEWMHSISRLGWWHQGNILKSGSDFPGEPVVKHPPAIARDTGSISGPGRSHMPQGN